MLFSPHDKILFIGDSISDYDRKRPVGEGLFNAWGTSYVADVGALLGCAMPDMHLRVVNMGIGGNQIRDLDMRWQEDVFDLKPDWVSVLIGINDVWRQFDCPAMSDSQVLPEEYRSNVETMILAVKDKVKGIFLLTPYYIEDNPHDAMRNRMIEYVDICKELAEKHGCILVDFQAMYERYLRHRHSASIAWDRVHPNEMGAMMMAKEFLKHCEFDYNAM